MTQMSTLILAADTSRLKPAVTDLGAVKRAGADTEAGIKRSMKAVEQAVGAVPAAVKMSARSFDELRASIDPAFASSQAYSQVQKELAALVQSGGATQRQANMALEQAASRYMGVSTASERAAASQRAAENAVQEATQSYNALRMSVDSIYASSKRYEAAQEQVNAAVRAGVITQAEANRTLALAETSYIGVGKAATASNTAVKAASGGMNSFAFQSRMAAMQLSQVAQQTMAGGGFIRALAIQLPDLALGFGAVGIAAGVAAGVLLPMAANFLTGADNAEAMEEALDSVTAAYQDFSSATDMAKKTVRELSLEFGSFALEMQRNYDILQGVALERALSSLHATIGALDVSRLEDLVGIFQQGQGEIEAFNDNYNRSLAEIKESFGLTGAQAETFLTQLNELKSADGPDQITRSADKLNKFLLEAYGSTRKMPPEIINMVQSLLEAQAVAARVAGNVDGSADSANRAATAAANLSGQLSVAAQYAGQLAANLAMAPAGIQGFQDKAAQLTAQISALDAGYSQITAGAAGYRKELEQKYGLADAANEAESNYISGLINRQVKEYTNVQELNKAYTDKVTALNKVASAGGAAGSATAKGLKAAAKEASALADEIERLEFDADPVKKYTAEMAKLDKLLANGLSDDAYSKAVERLGLELASTQPIVGDLADAFGDFIAGGLRDIGDLGQAFVDTLKRMIATAVSNPIRLAFAGNMGGVGSAASAATGAPGGGGILGGLLGGGGGAGGILGGIGGTLGAIGTNFGAGFMTSVYGGLGGLTGAVSGGLSVGGIAGISTAIGAIAAPLLAVAAVFSFFKTKTKQLDAGLRITTTGMDSLIQSFSTVEKKKFWGLSKKVRTSFSDLDAATAAPLESIIRNMQMGVMGAAEMLGIGADTFDKFTASIMVSTKGLSEADAQKAVEEALQGFGDDFAGMVPGLEALQQQGEGAYDALSRLATSLTTVNPAMRALGLSMYDMTLAGGDLASTFAGLFGGLEQFNASTSAYYNEFYTAQERTKHATTLLIEQLTDLGINALPASRAAFRALVDEANMLGDSDLVASLIQLAPAFAEITAASDALRQSITGLVDEDRYATGVDYMRGNARAQQGISYTPERSDAELRAEMRTLNRNVERLISATEITAANTGRGADAAVDQLDVSLGALS